jgi:hypothetical protein
MLWKADNKFCFFAVLNFAVGKIQNGRGKVSAPQARKPKMVLA